VWVSQARGISGSGGYDPVGAVLGSCDP